MDEITASLSSVFALHATDLQRSGAETAGPQEINNDSTGRADALLTASKSMSIRRAKYGIHGP